MSERSQAIEQDAVQDAAPAYQANALERAQDDVPPGYKRTEVGVIPLDWGIRPLGEIADLRNGYAFKSSTYQEDTYYKIITIANVQDGYMLLEACSAIHSLPKDLQEHQVLAPGDILISMTGNVGRVCVVDRKNCLLNQRVGKIIARYCDKESLFYILHDRRFLQEMIESAVGGAQGNIGKGDILSYLCLVPSEIEEQRAIATALSDADALIQSLDRLIAKKRAIKQAAMQQLLTGQTRLPGFTGEWETKRFGEVLERRNLKSYQIQTTDYRKSGKYSVVDQGQEEVVGFTDRDDKVFACPMGGVIVFGDHTCIVKFVYFDFAVGADGTQVLQAKTGQCTRFYGYQLEYNGVQPTGYNRHFKFLKEKSFPAPGRGEQTAIATVLSDMDGEIEALEHRREKARQIKLGMMQQLLTGRVRLIEAERKGVGCRGVDCE